MKKILLSTTLTATAALAISACAPVSPSIPRDRYNKATQPAVEPTNSSDTDKAKLPPPEAPKTITLQTEFKHMIVASEDLEKQLKKFIEVKPSSPEKGEEKGEKKNESLDRAGGQTKDDVAPILIRLNSDDTTLQKLAQEPIQVKTGRRIFAKKAVLVLAVNKEDKLFKDLKLNAWAFSKEKELGSIWTVRLDSTTSADAKKALAKEISGLALVIYPYSEKELLEFTLEP